MILDFLHQIFFEENQNELHIRGLALLMWDVLYQNHISKIGVEKLQRDNLLGWFIDDVDSDYTTKDFAKNDGLSVEYFKEWFKGKDFNEPKAIIHFTNFRYSTSWQKRFL